jgi:hypothetical protein
MAYANYDPTIVQMTPYLQLVLEVMSHYLPEGTWVTSAYRSEGDQVNTIMKQAHKHGYKKYKGENISINDLEAWYDARQWLIKRKYSVAPPIDYSVITARKGGKTKSRVVHRSKHISGLCLDLIHKLKKGEQRHGLIKIQKSFLKAQKDHKLILGEQLIEKNGCYHVAITKITNLGIDSVINPIDNPFEVQKPR